MVCPLRHTVEFRPLSLCRRSSGCAVEMVSIDPLDLQAVQDNDAGTLSTPLNGAEAGGTQ